MYVYFYYDEDGRLLYVGSTKDELFRFQQHNDADYWMDSVCSITVKGEYEVEDALYFERYYIAKGKPVYNKKSVYSIIENEAMIDNAPEHHFSDIESFIAYYSARPDLLHRATYYLRKVDIEAMNILKYRTSEDLVDIAPKAFEIGIKEIVKELGYTDVYETAYDRVVTGVSKKRGQKKSRATSTGRII